MYSACRTRTVCSDFPDQSVIMGGELEFTESNGGGKPRVFCNRRVIKGVRGRVTVTVLVLPAPALLTAGPCADAARMGAFLHVQAEQIQCPCTFVFHRAAPRYAHCSFCSLPFSSGKELFHTTGAIQIQDAAGGFCP